MKIFLNIKNIKTVALAAVFISLITAGCKKDDEEPAPVTPVDPKTRFIADWNCYEVSRRDGPAAQSFKVHIGDTISDMVLIENLYAGGFSYKTKALIKGDSIIVSPINQQVGGGLFIVYGKGKLVNSNKFTMTYVIDDANPIQDTVDGTFTK